MDKTFFGTEGSRVNVDLPVCTHHAKRQDTGKTLKTIGGAAKYASHQPADGTFMCDELSRMRQGAPAEPAHLPLIADSGGSR